MAVKSGQAGNWIIDNSFPVKGMISAGSVCKITEENRDSNREMGSRREQAHKKHHEQGSKRD